MAESAGDQMRRLLDDSWSYMALVNASQLPVGLFHYRGLVPNSGWQPITDSSRGRAWIMFDTSRITSTGAVNAPCRYGVLSACYLGIPR